MRAAQRGDDGSDSNKCDSNNTQGWGFERDVLGVACVVHRLLHGADVRAAVVRTGAGAWAFRAPLKRYWRTALWSALFGALLNARAATRADAVRVLGAARAPLVDAVAGDARLRREIRAQLGRALYVLDDYNAAQRRAGSAGSAAATGDAPP